jgi:hypothetical protein
VEISENNINDNQNVNENDDCASDVVEDVSQIDETNSEPEIASDPDVLTEVYIFENQRRSAFPPYDYGANSLPGERHVFSDESGKIAAEYSNLKASAPPIGYIWEDGSQWEVDKEYTQTDDEGWSYGIDFLGVMRNYRGKKSATKPFGRSVRRRRWRRKVRQSSDVQTESEGLNSFKHIPKALCVLSNGLKIDETEEVLKDTLLTVDPSTILVVEIFENQRRSALPPYDFGNNTFPGERSLFSDESGKVNAPYTTLDDALPPPGYIWDPSPPGVWTIDKDYTQTDENGWSYGIDFSAIMRNYRVNNSTTKAFGRSARRRRWIRHAIDQSIIRAIESLPTPNLETNGSSSFSAESTTDTAAEISSTDAASKSTKSSNSSASPNKTGESKSKSSSEKSKSNEIVQSASTEELPVPEMKRGYFKKEGNIVKVWPTFYFVLSSNDNQSTLSFYLKDLDTPPYGENFRGVINLKGSQVTRVGAHVSITDSQFQNSKFEFADENEKTEWIAAIKAHIAYSNYRQFK